MKKLIFGLIVLGTLSVAFFFGSNLSGRAALSVASDPSGEKVLLENKEVGTTPFFTDQLHEGDAVLSFGSFNQKVRLTAGALTAVSWILGPAETFSAGETVWFSPSSTGAELLVISKPAAEVLLDGNLLGDSPLAKPVSPGEHALELKKEGYFSRSLKLSVRDGFRLNVSAKLSLNPFPADPKKLSSPNPGLTVFDLASGNPLLLADLALWAKAAAFWDSRAGDQTTYQFFLTSDGKLYDKQGSEVSLDSLEEVEGETTVGYLGDGSTVFTTVASSALGALSPRLYPVPPQVEILPTGTGFLRVRSGPGKSYLEIGRATPGQKYPYLGEEGGWFKITFDGREGWVSGEFAKKL